MTAAPRAAGDLAVVPQVDPGERSDLAERFKSARRLIRNEDYAAARAILAQQIENRGDEARRLRLVAQAWQEEGLHEEAAECLKRALALRPGNDKIAAAYLGRLSYLDNYRAALRVHDQLTERVKASRAVAWETCWLYRFIGWWGHADAIQRAAGMPGGRTRNIAIALRRPIRPILLLMERRELEFLRSRTAGLEPLDAVGYPSLEQRYQVHAEVDRALLQSHRTRALLYLLNRILVYLYLAIAVFVFGSLLSIGAAVVPRVMVGLACAGGMYYVAYRLWNSTVTYRGAFAMAGSFALGCLAIGMAILRFIEGNQVLRLIGLGLIGGTAVLAVAMAGMSIIIPLDGYLRRRVNRRNARGLVLDLLAGLIVEIADPRNRGYAGNRQAWLWQLEWAARLLGRDVSTQRSPYDSRTAGWLADQCAGAAEGLRHMKLLVLSPAGTSWAHVQRLLRQQVAALATENWHNLIRRPVPDKPARRRKDIVVSAVRLALVALLPAASLFILAPWLDFGPDVLKWARVVVFGWAVLSVLFALDPALREKIETARDLVRTAREAGDKPRRDTGDGKAG